MERETYDTFEQEPLLVIQIEVPIIFFIANFNNSEPDSYLRLNYNEIDWRGAY